MKIQDLTVSERIMLAEALWNSVAGQDSQIELTENQKRELDLRMANFEVDRDTGSSWAEVKKRLTSKK
ncbi:MAG: addiction module protein [Hahellaceae bacterium]|nr:addiction module protein [Hahellaceae bacterium]MCP5170120.1 addiction module protein [Hahellaceae bacterium]